MSDDQPNTNPPLSSHEPEKTQDDKNVYIEFVKTKYATIKVAVAPLMILFLLGGIGVSLYQLQRQQDVRQRAAAGDVELRLEANKTYLQVGEEATVTVQMNTFAYEVTVADINLSFPPSLQVGSLTRSTFLSVPLGDPIITATTARIEVGATPRNPKKGQGPVAVFKVKALAPTDLAKVSFDTTLTGVRSVGLGTRNVGGTYYNLPIQVADSTAPPTGTASLKIISPSGSALVRGQTYDFPIQLTTNNVQSTGAEAAVVYSTEYFEYVSFTSGPFSDFPIREVRRNPITYIPNHEVAILELGNNPTEPRTGTGVIANLRLRVKSTVPSSTTLIQFDQTAKISALGQVATNVLSRREPLLVTFESVAPIPTATPTLYPSPTRLPNSVSLGILSNKTSALPGEDVQFSIEADAGTIQMTGAELHITYSSTLFSYVSFAPGPLLPSLVRAPSTESTGAQISVGSSPAVPATGRGIIGILTLRVRSGIAATTTPIGFTTNNLVSALGQLGNNVLGNVTPITFSIAGTAPTATPSPTSAVPTPTNTPIPTPTRAPTNTPIPTPTINPSNTRLGISVKLEGIGAEEQTSNKVPQNPSRSSVVEVINTVNVVVRSVTTLLTYDLAGYFSADVDLGTSIPSGQYLVKVKMDNSLRKLNKDLVTLAPSTKTTILPFWVVTGDIDQNNKLELDDYNLFRSCLDRLPICTSIIFKRTDLNDNGIIAASDPIDYNLLLRSFDYREGD